MQEEEKDNQEELDQEELAKQWEEALEQQQKEEEKSEEGEGDKDDQEELAKQWEEALKEQEQSTEVKGEETPSTAETTTSQESNVTKLLERIMDIPLTVEVIVGSTTMLLKDLLNIGPGSVIELDREINEPVDIRVNGKLMAQGELVVIGEKFGVRITEIYREEKKNIFRETLQERVKK